MDEWLDRLRERWRACTLLAAAGLLGLWWWQGRPLTQAPGVLAPLEPLQTAPDSPGPWIYHEHRITPLARFELRARVLGTERYHFDRPAELSPVDFALGWGPMSDSKILDAISIRQQDRWYVWSASNLPIPVGEITSHSANMHMIPANDGVRRRLLSVKTGQVVELRGQLIRADGKEGWHWISSLSRTDTGDGSCEVIWVESIRVTDR